MDPREPPRRDPGDVGRRVALRRSELGLTHEEVAHRAGMAPGYVRYLEEQPARLTAEALLRLAAALDTTPGALLGGGREAPPGQGPGAASAQLQTLTVEDCWALLRDRGVGRVALEAGGRLVVHPVNFAVVARSVLVRTAADSAVAEAARRGTSVSFEVDNLDEALHEAWSVLLSGPARLAVGEELAATAEAAVSPWAGGERHTVVVIVPDEVTGRRIRTRS
jgi:transcriptional regulator with XRE-family HTH domain